MTLGLCLSLLPEVRLLFHRVGLLPLTLCAQLASVNRSLQNKFQTFLCPRNWRMHLYQRVFVRGVLARRRARACAV
jgi:hypothetical protein